MGKPVKESFLNIYLDYIQESEELDEQWIKKEVVSYLDKLYDKLKLEASSNVFNVESINEEDDSPSQEEPTKQDDKPSEEEASSRYGSSAGEENENPKAPINPAVIRRIAPAETKFSWGEEVVPGDDDYHKTNPAYISKKDEPNVEDRKRSVDQDLERAKERREIAKKNWAEEMKDKIRSRYADGEAPNLLRMRKTQIAPYNPKVHGQIKAPEKVAI
jgi:hypothetical protein